jgi:hypothetical protein
MYGRDAGEKAHEREADDRNGAAMVAPAKG